MMHPFSVTRALSVRANTKDSHTDGVAAHLTAEFTRGSTTAIKAIALGTDSVAGKLAIWPAGGIPVAVAVDVGDDVGA